MLMALLAVFGCNEEKNEVKMKSGLIIVDNVVGEGLEAEKFDILTVNYTGKLEDGTVFDSSKNPGRDPFKFTVGMGDPKGVPIPVRPGSTSMRRDKSGQVVVSKLNEKLLIETAEAGEGAYIAGDRINGLVDERLLKLAIDLKDFGKPEKIEEGPKAKPKKSKKGQK